MNWAKIFYFDTPILEIFIRGSVMYLSLFFLLRLILKRQTGTVAITDLLLIVLIADAAQNGMADNYTSVADGILLVATLIFWNFFLDWLGYRFPFIHRFIHPPALLLIKNGQMIFPNLKKEFLTKQELLSQLRQQGIESIDEVKEAYMEGDGRISVVRKSKQSRGEHRKNHDRGL